MRLGDVPANGQSQSGSMVFPGRKKRLKHLSEVLLRNARTSIRDFEEDAGMAGACRVSCGDLQFSSGRHGVQGVVTQVEQDLFDLITIRVGGQSMLTRSDDGNPQSFQTRVQQL